MKSFAIASFAGIALARPFSFPLGNGFPHPNDAALARLYNEAGGSLPNSPLPSGVSPEFATSFQLLAANEIFEVAYFTELYQNVTNKVEGYEVDDADFDFIQGAIYRIRAQEEFHALGLNAILQANGYQIVEPCKYDFPVANFSDAILLAQTFTDVVLGVLPQVQLQAANEGKGATTIPLVGSIAEQEAEQVGWFRTLQKKYPSAAPFLTAAAPQFALSVIKEFFVPGSCPALYNDILTKVPSFPLITVTSPPVRHSKQIASYSVPGPLDASCQVLAYISGQNVPVLVSLDKVKTVKGISTFDAAFPAAAKLFADGLVVAAVVPNGTYTNAADVAAKTIYGPGLIEYY